MMHRIIEKRVDEELYSLLENPIPLNEDKVPDLEKKDYEERIEKLWRMPQSSEYGAVIIYGDREHFSNVDYFTGYDPRWEETLLILRKGRKPCLLVGNEGIGYVKKVALDTEIEFYQTFSLMGQPNDSSRALADIFKEKLGGVSGKLGIIGFKAYAPQFHMLDGIISDVPHYMIETLKRAVNPESMENATGLMADCEYGLKHCISAKEAVQFEAAGTKISRGVYRCLKHLKPGMNELEASIYCGFDGSPANMHPNINFGDRNVSLGLNSPTAPALLAYGDSVGVGYGLRGSLVHKCGMFLRNRDDLPEEKGGYIETFLEPYFSSIISWYENMRIGKTFGDIYNLIDRELDLKAFGCTLNPGHLTHTDEWTNSPFIKNSSVEIRSGMAIQCDYTVTKQNPFMSAHVEDGLIIADALLRKEMEELSPACMERIRTRKRFIMETLGIDLPEEVLPLSDLGCICFPYMADLKVVLAKET